jgi:lysophospholipase L1-like esterase
VTIWTGGNIAKDVMTKSYIPCDSTVVDSFGLNMENIIAEILKLRSKKYTIIHLIEFFQFRVNVLQELDILEEKKTCVMYYNERSNQVASEYNISVARIHLAFNGSLGDEDAEELGYLIDDVHFSNAGDLFIAKSLRELGYESLYSPDPKTNLIASCRSYYCE